MNSTSEAHQQPPTTGGWLAPYGLIRPHTDRKIAGVGAAIGRVTGTDPLLWRVLLAVLVVFAGAGLVLYTVAWLFFPSEGDQGSAAEAILTPRTSSVSTGSTVGLAIVAFITANFAVFSDTGRTFVVLGALAIGIPVLLKHQKGAIPPVSATAPPHDGGSPGYEPPFAPGGPYAAHTATAPTDTTSTASTTQQLPNDFAAAEQTEQLPRDAIFTPPPSDDAWQHITPPSMPMAPPPQAPPTKPTKAKRRRSRLGLLTVCFIVTAMSIMSIIAMAGATVPFSAFVAVALAICGFGLIIGTWLGRSPLLYVLGGLLSVTMVANMLMSGAGLTGFDGSRQLAVSSASTIPARFDVQFGGSRLDLRDVNFAGDTEAHVTSEVLCGDMEIQVSPEVTVILKVPNARGANVELDGKEIHGGRNHVAKSDGEKGGGTLVITTEVNLGQLEVTR